MERLGFELDWLDGDGIQGPELAATYARVQIRIGDSILTWTADRQANAMRDYLLVPLYPLAEWLASNWWTLRYESENPASRKRQGFRERHSLRTGREGYTLPRPRSGVMGHPHQDREHHRPAAEAGQRTRSPPADDKVGQHPRALRDVRGPHRSSAPPTCLARRCRHGSRRRLGRRAIRGRRRVPFLPSRSPSWMGPVRHRRPATRSGSRARRAAGRNLRRGGTGPRSERPRGGLSRDHGRARRGQRPSPSMPRDGLEGTRSRAGRPTSSPSRRGARLRTGCAKRSAPLPFRFGHGRSWPARWGRIPGCSKRCSGRQAGLPRCRSWTRW